VTAPGATIAGSTSAQDAARDWQALRADSDIQYAPVKPPKVPEAPDWLRRFSEWLEAFLRKIFGPLGEGLGVSWPVLKTIGIALLILLVLAILWFWVLRPLLEARLARRAGQEEPEWAPEHTAAAALLADADRLAAEGRYGEAAHLLLLRSVHHIAEARPGWLQPASTAREIAVLPMLPDRARRAFSVIATRVERSLFALHDLDLADWRAARAAYADFALQRLPGGA
jgi:hypothetical protein